MYRMLVKFARTKLRTNKIKDKTERNTERREEERAGGNLSVLNPSNIQYSTIKQAVIEIDLS